MLLTGYMSAGHTVTVNPLYRGFLIMSTFRDTTSRSRAAKVRCSMAGTQHPTLNAQRQPSVSPARRSVRPIGFLGMMKRTHGIILLNLPLAALAGLGGIDLSITIVAIKNGAAEANPM